MTLEEELKREALKAHTRRDFLTGCTGALGSLFMANAGVSSAFAAETNPAGPIDFSRNPSSPLSPLPPQFAPKARRVIFMHMAGAPSNLDLFDYKPELERLNGLDTPASFLEGKTFAFIRGVPKLLGPVYPFKQHGESGAWLSDRLPHLSDHVDDICFIKSMRTEQFNHAPAQLLMQTGETRAGFPSIGSWATYGLGTENQNLPGFMVLLSGGNSPSGGTQLWNNGFLPSVYQGVNTRSEGEPVLYLNNPDGVSRSMRRRMLDSLNRLNQANHTEYGNPETITRIAQYEMAYRMQMEATDVLDNMQESQKTLDAYGVEPSKGSFANNCLRARRLVERGVRFVQLYHWGWDTHGDSKASAINEGFKDRCREVDQPIAALLTDLKQRGLLEDTLVVWSSEFGRTPMQENRGGREMAFIGRDHNPNAFTIWMAGGGAKGGVNYGKTDDMGYEIAENPVEVRDFHATMLHLLGFDHHKLTYPFQGLDNKLTRVRPARVIGELLA